MSDPFGLTGTVLENRYRIDACVGEGGFGVVYRATHTVFGKPVAIKLLKVPAHFVAAARAAFVHKFVREGQVVAGLSEAHPAVVKILDVGVVTLGGLGVPYLALEWLEGQTLEDGVERRGPLGEADLIDLLLPVVDALGKAHGGAVGAVIAHRDIKPQNLFVTFGADGRRSLRLLDFGIAKVMQEGDDATRSATGATSTFAAYSPPFGAPEQFNPEDVGASGPATDVHAIGLVIGYALTGRLPYRGKNPIQMAMEALGAKRPTPRALGANVSDALEAVCARALAVRPEDRYRTAAELAAALRAVPASARAEAPRAQGHTPPVPDPPRPAGAPKAATTFEVPDFDPRSSGRGPTQPSPAAWAAGAPDANARARLPQTELDVEAFRLKTQTATARASTGELPQRPLVEATEIEPRRGNRGLILGGVVGAVLIAGLLGAIALNEVLPVARGLGSRPSSAPFVVPAAPAGGCPTGMALLEAGTFAMGAAESPHKEQVSTFCLDQTEVTASSYASCVSSGKCTTPHPGGTFEAAGLESHPIDQVDWYQAERYCEALDKRLPSEVEWEYAAQGGKDAASRPRGFPWGDAAPTDQVCWAPVGKARPTGWEQTCPVGSYPAGDGVKGLHDLAGNVWEWTSSRDGAARVIRGGSWRPDDAAALRAANRAKSAPSEHNDHTGFRCARSPG